MLSTEGKNHEIVQQITDEQHFFNVVECEDEGIIDDDAEDDNVVSLVTIKRFVEYEECPDCTFLHGLRACLGLLRTQRGLQVQQTRIKYFF